MLPFANMICNASINEDLQVGDAESARMMNSTVIDAILQLMLHRNVDRTFLKVQVNNTLKGSTDITDNKSSEYMRLLKPQLEVQSQTVCVCMHVCV